MKRVFILTFFSFALNLVSQTKPPTYKNYFDEGSFLLIENDADGALKNFLIAYQMDSSSANINYMLGICYLQSSMKKSKAEYHLAKAVKSISNTYKSDLASETAAPPLAYFFYGEALQINYKFEEALKEYGEFNKFVDPKDAEYLKMLEKEEATTSLAKTMVANPINVMITNLGDSVNSEYPDYSPVLSADEKTLIFTTRRPTSTGGQKTPDGQYFEDIVVCYKNENDQWSKPVSLSPNVNSMGHEASINLSPDGQTLIVFKDNNGNGDIYYTTFDGSGWSTLREFGSNVNTEFWESHACLNADGTVLFFVSDRPGGYGGKDIYRCVKLPNGEWSKALNMGSNINSEYDEDGAFIHPDGQSFFFSTNGYKTMGGYDIMYATLDEENKFSNVTNIGYPVNTTDDDIFYVTSPDGKRSYFSSAKREGYGEKDIYRITLAEPREKFLALFKGQLIPAEGENLPDNISIIVRDKETNEIVGNYKPRIVNGSFSTILPPGRDYNFSYRTESGEEFYNEDVSVSKNQSYQELHREVNLEPVTLVGKIKVKQKFIVLNTKVLASRKNKKAIVKAKITLAAAGSENQVFESDSSGSYNGVILDYDKNYILYAEFGSKKTASVEINTSGEKYARVINQQLYLTGKAEKYTSKELMLDVLVKNPKTGEQVADAQVFLTSTDGEKHELKSNAQGLIKNVPLSPETRYSLIANKDGFSSEKITFTTSLVQDGSRYSKEIELGIEAIVNANPDCNLPDTQYEIYFKYNRNKKESTDACWESYINKLVELSKKRNVLIIIEASASRVPTRSFKNNDQLAASRAAKLKKEIIQDVNAKGGRSNKLQFAVSSKVGGPKYRGDAVLGRQKYEAHQYAKSRIK